MKHWGKISTQSVKQCGYLIWNLLHVQGLLFFDLQETGEQQQQFQTQNRKNTSVSQITSIF